MSFCTVINCMDGRVQLPVINYLSKRFGVEYVDNITEPGPDAILAKQTDTAAIASIMRRVDISVHGHRSKTIAIVGHCDCGGNPANKDEHFSQVRTAIEFLQNRYKNIEIIGLWLDEQWQVSEIPCEAI